MVIFRAGRECEVRHFPCIYGIVEANKTFCGGKSGSRLYGPGGGTSVHAADTGASNCEGSAQPDEGKEHQDQTGLLHTSERARHCSARSPHKPHPCSHSRHPVFPRVSHLFRGKEKYFHPLF